MEIILGKTAGFCYGVRNTIKKTTDKLNDYQSIACLGELVHNQQVIQNLTKRGLKTIDALDQAKDRVIIRAHGVPKQIYQQAQQKQIELFDFTCPNVLSIHKIAEQAAQQGNYIFLIGEKNHPENVGTISFCGEHTSLIETAADLAPALTAFQKSGLKKLVVVAQTTFSTTKFQSYVTQIRQALDATVNLQVRNTICNATQIRQAETARIARTVPCMIIIGGKNSANTNKLYDIARANCPHAFIIETAKDLDVNYVKQFAKIGIMAGASTPDDSINAVIAALQA